MSIEGIQTHGMKTPVGTLYVMASASGIVAVEFEKEEMSDKPKPGAKIENAELAKCVAQLEEYFAGKRKVFDVQLDYLSTPFRMSVWRALLTIPYGETWSYGELARNVGKPTAFRAVGGANHNNPISIIIPCHRVIGSDGTLTGYGGGLWRKEWLLDHEKKHA